MLAIPLYEYKTGPKSSGVLKFEHLSHSKSRTLILYSLFINVIDLYKSFGRVL